MVDFPQSVLAKYLIDSGVAVDGGGIRQDDDWSGAWYVTSDKMPEFYQNWITVRHVMESLQDKPVREQSNRTTYAMLQLSIKADTQPNGRTKGRQIVDLLDKQLFNAVVVLNAVSYRLQNFSQSMGGLMFLEELERNRQQVFVLNGNLTIWEI